MGDKKQTYETMITSRTNKLINSRRYLKRRNTQTNISLPDEFVSKNWPVGHAVQLELVGPEH